MNDSELYFKAYQDGLSMRTSFMWVTPEMAGEWLAKNTRNRKPRTKGVALYAHEIREGRWAVHHQGIAFDSAGRLADGQHRLQAILDTGIPVPLNVTFNLPPGSMEAVDRGMARSVPDVLRLEHGVEHSGRVVALVNIIAVVAEKYYLKLSPGATMKIARKWQPQILWALTLPHVGRLWKAPIVAAFIIAHRKDAEDVEHFVTSYRENNGLVTGEPEHYLREQLLEHDRDVHLQGPALTRWVAAVVWRRLSGEVIKKNGGVRPTDDRGLDYFLDDEGGAS